MESSVEQIKEALAKNKTTIIAANCSVKYNGRAQSFLEEGDRIILIKEDNTILIHQSAGSTPINYMKAGTHHELETEDGKNYRLKSSKDKEYLSIHLIDIHFVNSIRLDDGKKLELAGTEKDMADMIYNNPQLIGADFKPLSREEHTKYGFIDVFGYDKEKVLVVVECKRYCGNLQAVSQLRRYVEKIKESKGLKEVKGVLACPKITPNAKKMLEDFGFSFAAVEPPNYMERFNKKQKSILEF